MTGKVNSYYIYVICLCCNSTCIIWFLDYLWSKMIVTSVQNLPSGDGDFWLFLCNSFFM